MIDKIELYMAIIALGIFVFVLFIHIVCFFMKKFCEITDNSKYAYLIIQWILTQKKNMCMTDEDAKKFISVKDMDMIKNIQNFINTLSAAKATKMKFKDIKHPFFSWHGVLFMRTTGNDIVRVDTGVSGKIPMDEEIISIEINDSFVKILSIIEFANKLMEKFGGANGENKN